MNEDTILKKLVEHDGKFDQVMGRFSTQDEKFDKVLKKLVEHDGKFGVQDEKFDKVLKKLVEHDGKFGVQDEKFGKVLKKLVEHDGKFERVITRVVDIDERTKNLATQEIMDKKFEGVTQTLDDQTVILKRLDQERLFMLERVKRIEADVEKLKLQLHLA